MKNFKPKDVLELDRELEKVAVYMRFSMSTSQSYDPKHDGSDEKALAALRWSLLAERRILWNNDKRFRRRLENHEMVGFKPLPDVEHQH